MQEKVKQLVERYELTASPESRYIDLVTQIGELGKTILEATDYGYRSFKASEEMKHEAGSCLFSLLALLNDYGLDETEILEDVLQGYETQMKQYMNETKQKEKA